MILMLGKCLVSQHLKILERSSCKCCSLTRALCHIPMEQTGRGISKHSSVLPTDYVRDIM